MKPMNNHMDIHPAREINLHGQYVMVDLGILDLVQWINRIPGVVSHTSCQGCAPDSCSDDAFIGFTTGDETGVEAIEPIMNFIGGVGFIEDHDVRDGRHWWTLRIQPGALLPEFNREKFGRESA